MFTTEMLKDILRVEFAVETKDPIAEESISLFHEEINLTEDELKGLPDPLLFNVYSVPVISGLDMTVAVAIDESSYDPLALLCLRGPNVILFKRY